MINPTTNCIKCDSNNCWLIKYCSSEWLEFAQKHIISRRYKKKEHVIYEKSLMKGIFFIHSGKVKVYKTGIGKKQQVVRLSKSGDILGHRGFNREYWPISAEVIEESCICSILNYLIICFCSL